jgi:hypothetical protein
VRGEEGGCVNCVGAIGIDGYAHIITVVGSYSYSSMYSYFISIHHTEPLISLPSLPSLLSSLSYTYHTSSPSNEHMTRHNTTRAQFFFSRQICTCSPSHSALFAKRGGGGLWINVRVRGRVCGTGRSVPHSAS